jgi:integrase
LRVSEVVNLKISNIDSKNMPVLIERLKGKKDRYLNLPETILEQLRDYFKEYRPMRKTGLCILCCPQGIYNVFIMQLIDFKKVAIRSDGKLKFQSRMSILVKAHETCVYLRS